MLANLTRPLVEDRYHAQDDSAHGESTDDIAGPVDSQIDSGETGEQDHRYGHGTSGPNNTTVPSQIRGQVNDQAEKHHGKGRMATWKAGPAGVTQYGGYDLRWPRSVHQSLHKRNDGSQGEDREEREAFGISPELEEHNCQQCGGDQGNPASTNVGYGEHRHTPSDVFDSLDGCHQGRITGKCRVDCCKHAESY